jgi:hypothetical protein
MMQHTGIHIVRRLRRHQIVSNNVRGAVFGWSALGVAKFIDGKNFPNSQVLFIGCQPLKKVMNGK